MIDHLVINVSSSRFKEVVEWYEATLAPLGWSKQVEFDTAVGLGTSKSKCPFWIGTKEGKPETVAHFALTAPDHKTVDKCYEAAIKAGGTCNGPPGERPKYHPGYYGAFIVDPVGNNFELVDHGRRSEA